MARRCLLAGQAGMTEAREHPYNDLARGKFLAAIIFFLANAHLFLMERALFQNHYYMVLLVSGLMALAPAGRAFSLDALRRSAASSRTVPAWSLWAIRFQIAAVYVFKGIAEPETLIALSLVLSAGLIALRVLMGIGVAREFTREALQETRGEAA